MGADFGGAAHLLGHRKRALEQLVERGAQSACVRGGAYRVFHLTQNLRLAQHHGIEAAGDAEGVARGMLVLVAVAVFPQRMGFHAPGLGQPVQGLRHVLEATRAIHLGAVAGGENRRLQVRADRAA